MKGVGGLKKFSVKYLRIIIFEIFLTKRQIDMIDVDVSFVNISANNDDNNNNSSWGQNFGQILAKFQPNFGMWAIIGEFYNFGQIF